jgi:Cys-tRNA(Pro) deacylase
MAKAQFPVTTAVRALREAKVAFEPHLYAYEEKGGTRVSSRELGVDEHSVIKTLVMEDDAKQPLIVLMHGDRQVSTKDLARQLGQRKIAPCDPATAEKHTGYQVGGTSPFGTRRALPVYVERTILLLPRIFINGGKRGFLVAIDPRELGRVLAAEPVDAAQAS